MVKIRAESCLAEPCGERWYGSEMKRIYERGEDGKGYRPIGWKCKRGHVKLDNFEPVEPAAVQEAMPV